MASNTYNPSGGYGSGLGKTYSRSTSGFTARDYKNLTSGANLLGTFMEASGDVNAAKFDKFTSEQQARLLIRNAENRYAQGTRQAGEVARKGRGMESDAIAAMVAQGGTVDPTILAKIKAQTTQAALEAVFQGTRESGGMRLQAQSIESASAINYANAKASASRKRFGAAATLMGAYS